MIEVELYAAGGDLVARVQVPGYAPLPAGIMWGERCFFRRQRPSGGRARASGADVARYDEGLLYVVPHERGQATGELGQQGPEQAEEVSDGH